MRLYDDGELTYCVDEDVSWLSQIFLFHTWAELTKEIPILIKSQHSGLVLFNVIGAP